jgi:hypothetical protein
MAHSAKGSSAEQGIPMSKCSNKSGLWVRTQLPHGQQISLALLPPLVMTLSWHDKRSISTWHAL